MSGHPGGMGREVADAVKGYQSGLSQQAAPLQSDDSINPLALLQSYRANPFSLQTDMSRPAQFLPPEIGNFDYGAQWRAQNAPPALSRLGAGQPGQPSAWEGPGNSASDGLAGEIGSGDGRTGGTDGMGGLGMGMGGNGGGDGGGGGGK